MLFYCFVFSDRFVFVTLINETFGFMIHVAFAIQNTRLGAQPRALLFDVFLFHCYALCQVAGLVNVAAFGDGYIVAQQL